MGLSKNIGTYADCKRLLDTALKHGGLRHTPSKSPWHLRARCYMYRRLLHDQFLGIPGHRGVTPYDSLLLDIEGDVLIIRELPPVELAGGTTDLEGNPITAVVHEDFVDDDDFDIVEDRDA